MTKHEWIIILIGALVLSLSVFISKAFAVVNPTELFNQAVNDGTFIPSTPDTREAERLQRNTVTEEKIIIDNRAWRANIALGVARLQEYEVARQKQRRAHFKALEAHRLQLEDPGFISVAMPPPECTGQRASNSLGTCYPGVRGYAE